MELLKKLDGYKTLLGAILLTVSSVLFSMGKLDTDTKMALDALATSIMTYGFYHMVRRKLSK